MLSLGVTPTEILLEAVGSADCPASGGRQMPCHWGHRERHVVTQSSATGSQCLPAVGCAEAIRYIQGRGASGLSANGDEIAYVSIGEGATSEGEFWESLNTACRLHLPVLFLVADNGYAISVRSEDQSPAPISEMVRGFRGLAVTKIDGTDYFESRRLGAKAVAHVRAAEGPGLIHAKVTRPYSHSAADTQSKYRPVEELDDEALHDPIRTMEQTLLDVGAITPEQLERSARRRRKRSWKPPARRWRLADRTPPPSSSTSMSARRSPTRRRLRPPVSPAPATSWPSARRSGEPSHEVYGGRRTDPRVRRGRRRRAPGDHGAGRGQGRCVRHHLRPAAHVRRSPAVSTRPLAEANIVGRAVGQASPGPAAEPGDPVLRLHLAGHDADQDRGGDRPLALQRRLVVPARAAGPDRAATWWAGRSGASQCGESIFAHVPGLIVMFPSRAEDAAGMLRAAFRCEDPVLFLEHKHLLRQPHTRDPVPAGGLRHPARQGPHRPGGHRRDHRHLRRHRRTVPPGRRPGRR